MKIKIIDMLDARRKDGGGRETWLSFMVMHLMTAHTKSAADWGRVFSITPGDKDNTIDLKVSVNGVELDFLTFIDTLEVQHSEMVQKCAIAILKERGLNGLHDMISKLEKNIEEKIEEVFPGFRNERW